MALDDHNGSTRRSVLAAGGGAALALVAQALGRPIAARAANGDPVTAGADTTATARTSVTATGADGFAGVSDTGTALNGTSTSGIGVYAESSSLTAMHAGTYTGIAVVADSGATDQPAIRAQAYGHSTGVLGYSGQLHLVPAAVPRVGVYGHSAEHAASIGVLGKTTNGVAVRGEATEAGMGVQGYSGTGPLPAVSPKTGVYGYANQDATAMGVRGTSISGIGVHGSSSSNFGVHGSSTTNVGVYANSNENVGIHGANQSEFHPAIRGAANAHATGVQGYSGTGPAPTTPSKTGVYGYAAQAANARGVYGQTTIGRGVEGRATSGFGMFAQATTGQALQAGATTGTGVYAFADTNGTALRAARGHVKFSTAGLATIAAGSDSVTVTPGFDISTSSKVLAVLQGDPGGTTVLRYVARDAAGDTFTIRLSANAGANTPVAWFVIS